MSEVSILSFLPKSIIRYERSEKPWEVREEGIVLFADVSGFTPMSEALSVLGAEGAEYINLILNQYFETMIAIIHSYNGEVMKFGGDAILCYFSGIKTLPWVIAAALDMQREMPRFSNMKTPVKSFTLKMKIGIAAGEVLLAGLGDPAVRCEYAFAGAPVDASADAEHMTDAGEVTVASTESVLDSYNIRYSVKEKGYYRIESVPDVELTVDSSLPHDNGRVKSYMIPEVHDMVAAGFEKHVGTLHGCVPVFLKFSGFSYNRQSFRVGRFHNFFCRIMEVTHRYHGRLNHVSMGDKGSTCYFLFGAPLPLEKKEALSCAWALDVQKTITHEFPEVTLSIGINSGRIFSGIVGGAGRYDYTSLGDAVNFAARLMQKAEQSQILISESVYDSVKESFACVYRGHKEFKGKSEPLAVYSLEAMKGLKHTRERIETIWGRDDEIEQIEEHLTSARQGNPAALVITGAAGTGKSFLAYHVATRAEASGWNVFGGTGDVTRQNHVYTPWKVLLSNLIFSGHQFDERVMVQLLDDLNESPDNLSLFNTFFSTARSRLDEGSDENYQKGLFHRLVAKIVLHHAEQTPLLIIFENLHWFDSLSLELLISVLDRSHDEKIVFLGTTRPEWSAGFFERRPYYSVLTLAGLKKETVRQLIESRLDGTIREDLVSFLYEQTRGNPFYLEQIYSYLLENEYLEKRLGTWTLKKGIVIEKSMSEQDLIVARAESIPASEKVHLHYATCIGPVFDEPLVRKAMGRNFRVRVWQSLAQRGFFDKEKKSSLHTFRQSIIQDALYHSIPRNLRKSIHRRIGLAMEKLYCGEIDVRAPNLANHFYLAEMRTKAIDYGVRAARNLRRNHMFAESCRYYERLYNLLKYSKQRVKWETALEYAMNLHLIGRNDAALPIIKKVRKETKEKGDYELYCNATLNWSNILEKANDFSYLDELATLVTSEHYDTQGRLNIKINLAIGKLRTGKVYEAEQFFLEIRDSASKSKLQKGDAKRHSSFLFVSACYYLAAINKVKSMFDVALEYIDQGIEKARSEGLKESELTLTKEKANILNEMDRSDESLALYEKLQKKVDDSGDLISFTTFIINYANILITHNQLDRSELLLQEGLQLSLKLALKQNMANVENLSGYISFMKKQYQESYDHYEQALKYQLEIQNSADITDSYYNLCEVCVLLGRQSEAENWAEKFKNIAYTSKNDFLIKLYGDLRQMVDSMSERG